MASILIIDDDQMICDVMARMMNKLGHESQIAYTGSVGVELAQSDFFDIVFLDINLPDANGLGLISSFKATPSSPEVIIITGDSDPDGAEMAIKFGAWSYIEKPFRQHEISLELSRALQFRREKGEVPTSGGLKRKGIIGRDSRIKSCLEKVPDAAYSDSNVLITGEMGTGKKLFARTIHLNSIRADNHFVILECSGLTRATIEKRLLGDANQTIAGAAASGTGLLYKAHNGTLFLQEVDTLPCEIQDTLAQILKTRTMAENGKAHRIESNFKVIASTTRNLDSLVQDGAFNSELLGILDDVRISLPPLRGRGQDITSIALFYIQKYCAARSLDTKGVTPEFIDIINQYSWPKNVKELSTAMEMAVASAQNEPTMYSIHLPPYIKSKVIQESNPPAPDTPRESARPRSSKGPETIVPPFDSSPFPKLKTVMEDTEKAYLEKLMSHTANNVTKACSLSGISKSSMYQRLRKYGLV
ncbi:MAG: sigma-54-dependent Fis family transcriptional regulator [Desulfobacteraceae bacterium]|nr:MAG: sigma-54-dependent Fis family transcriptional regulator [Desulfobacteraceae bacterium]